MYQLMFVGFEKEIGFVFGLVVSKPKVWNFDFKKFKF